jgi:hypothetical protein
VFGLGIGELGTIVVLVLLFGVAGLFALRARR